MGTFKFPFVVWDNVIFYLSKVKCNWLHSWFGTTKRRSNRTFSTIKFVQSQIIVIFVLNKNNNMEEQILNLRTQGLTYNEIQKQLNCSKGTIAYYCGKGQKEKTLNRGKKRRLADRQWLTDIKNKLKCEHCGETRDWVLDFHHLDPLEKEKGISELLSRTSKDKIIEEIKRVTLTNLS